jgi:anti-sigma-K factor RskA
VDLEEIKVSGLLEQYVMDMLSPAEKAEVESYIRTYPELRKELYEIESSLEIFAKSAAIESPPGVKEKILDAIRKNPLSGERISGRPSNIWAAVAAIFGLGILVLGYLLFQKNNENSNLSKELISFRDTCQTNTNELNRQLDLLRQLTEPNNKILTFQATPGFASTDLYLHTNKITKRNFIQVRNLPHLADNQSFELWSIKANEAPKPLTVFGIPENGLIEVDYVEGTQVYAITIEVKGGVQSPTMANLIGTVNVAEI